MVLGAQMSKQLQGFDMEGPLLLVYTIAVK